MITCLAIACLLSPPPAAPSPVLGQDEPIEEALASAMGGAIEEGVIPAAIGAIVTVDQPTRVGAIGVRKVGSKKPFLPTDMVHIGSDTKAMTGVLIGRLVDQGKLRWDSTVKEVLASIAGDVHEDFHGVTVAQLMQMTAGVPEDPLSWRIHRGKPLQKRRLLFAKGAMKEAPLSAPGTSFLYSNLSVMIAGAMAEAAGDGDWEDLMRKEVFGPLGMETASFGIPGKKNKVEEPWGHETKNGKLVPIQGDNDVALGPAGTVFLSMEDWGKFVSVFLADDAADDADAFLKNATRRALVTPNLQQYAMGWFVVDQPWSNGKALNHAGSNTMWLANAWLAPGRKTAFLVATNAYNRDNPGPISGVVNDGILALLGVARKDWK